MSHVQCVTSNDTLILLLRQTYQRCTVTSKSLSRNPMSILQSPMLLLIDHYAQVRVICSVY